MSRCACCSYPNGFKTIIPCLLSNAAFILTSIATYSCRYAETQIDEYSGVSIGIVSREMTHGYTSSGRGYCTSYAYTDNVLDTKFKAAQGCSFTAWIVGFIMCIVVWSIAPCVVTPKEGWRVIGGLFFIVGCFQAFTLLILSSSICSRGCSLKSGGTVAIMAFLCWWTTAAICCMIPDPIERSNSRFVHPRGVAETVPVQMELPVATMASETTTQRIEADGTVIIEKVTTNPDGGMTVTTSSIPPAAAVAITPDANFEKV